jgi:hypothetical protein
VQAILQRCRERDPRRRPTAAQVASALRGETLPLTAVTWVRSTYLQRRWAPAAALAAVLAAAGIAIGLIATNRSSPPAPPPPVAQVARSTDTVQQARNLVVWLRRYSAG